MLEFIIKIGIKTNLINTNCLSMWLGEKINQNDINDRFWIIDLYLIDYNQLNSIEMYENRQIISNEKMIEIKYFFLNLIFVKYKASKNFKYIDILLNIYLEGIFDFKGEEKIILNSIMILKESNYIDNGQNDLYSLIEFLNLEIQKNHCHSLNKELEVEKLDKCFN